MDNERIGQDRASGGAARRRSPAEEGPGLTLTLLTAGLSVSLTIAVLLLIFLASRTPATAPIEIHPPPPTPTPGPTATPAPLVVYVTGAVNQPGVVRLPVGARVEHAVAATGGLTQDAADSVNLAAPLFDGQHGQIPAAADPLSSAGLADQSGVGGSTVGGALININTATADRLMDLPGVGEVTAAAIVVCREEHGPSRRIEEIMDVPGIGEGKFEGFKELITVGP